MRKNKLKGKTLEERFWMLVQKPKSGDKTACWLFKNVPNSKGYGKFQFEGEEYAAHRVALEIKLGRKIKEGMQANHINDCNKLCCNPDHLREGTCSENIKEAHRNGKCKIWTAKARKEQSAKLKGLKRTEQQKENLSQAALKRWADMSAEERQQQVEAMRPNWLRSGKGMPKKMRDAISATMMGHSVSDETRNKMSEKASARWARYRAEKAAKAAAEKENSAIEKPATT